MNLYILIIIYFIIFSFYLELNPSITNIWYRFMDDGKRHIQLWNLIDFIIEPFRKKELWYPEFWDLNFFIGIFILIFTYYIIKFIYQKLNT